MSEESSSQSSASGVGGVKREETTREQGWSSTDYSHSQVRETNYGSYNSFQTASSDSQTLSGNYGSGQNILDYRYSHPHHLPT